ncbi:MAG: hypothetical protein MUE97_07655 [Phycisphaerales bacterium]|jgi:hypothetical protein|nr:hypothetical protein [Phycisphaerales bacterium]
MNAASSKPTPHSSQHVVIIDARVCFWSIMPARADVPPRSRHVTLTLADRLDAAEHLATRLPLHRSGMTTNHLALSDLAIAARPLADGRTLVLAAPRAALAEAHLPHIAAIHPDALPPWLAADPALRTLDPRTLNLLDPACTVSHPETLAPLHTPAQRVVRQRRIETGLLALIFTLTLLATGLTIRTAQLRRASDALTATFGPESPDALLARATKLIAQRPDPLPSIMPELLALHSNPASDPSPPTWSGLRLTTTRLIIDLNTTDRDLASSEARRFAASLRWPLPPVPAEPIRTGPTTAPIFRLTFTPPTAR